MEHVWLMAGIIMGGSLGFSFIAGMLYGVKVERTEMWKSMATEVINRIKEESE